MKSYIKVIFAIISVSIVLLLANYICSFTGNPFKFYTVKKQVYNYLRVKYKDNNFKIFDTSYNFKDGSYIIEVAHSGKINENFNVNVSSNGSIKDYYIENQYKKYIENNIYSLFENDYKNFKAYVNVVLPEKYKYNIVYMDMNDTSGIKMLINIKWIKSSITKTEFVKNCKSINDTLLEHRISADSCYYSCECKSGIYSMSMFKEKGYGISYDMSNEDILKSNQVTFYRR